MAFQNGFAEYAKQMKRMTELVEEETPTFVAQMGSRALAKTKKRTPVDLGLLRSGWRLSKVERAGNKWKVTLFNNTEYALYIEYGHRLVIGGKTKGRVKGRFMMTTSCKEVENEMPGHWIRFMRKLWKEAGSLD
ncbi:HK97 gp10 family phage protein [Paenibacillus apiarius]|uniref:HK97 gp10 family phage protein n=1 Tax=Paenibacillus apiarius TaxID=46240 RepID=UPI003B3BD150